MKLLRKLFFAVWYWRNPPWDTNQTPPELEEFIDTHPPGRALDLGCGTGTNVITLAKRGWNVTGVDFIPKAIRVARRKADRQELNVNLQIGDVTKLNGLSGNFDLIYDIGCFHSLDPSGMQAYRNNIEDLLKPGGTFMLYLFFRDKIQSSGSGASEADLPPFNDFLNLTKREDGTEREARRSSWLWYQKPI